LFLITGKLWAILVIDEATNELAIEALEDPGGEAAFEAYERRWASIRGHFAEIVSDAGGEFVAKSFIARCEASGVFKKVTAAKSSESHGKVERPIRTVRWTVDRLKEELREEKKEWSLVQWNKALHSIENGIRNEVLVAGTSSSMRGTGRCSSMHLNTLTDTAVTGAEVTPDSLMDVQRRAQKAYVSTVWNRKLRAILAEQSAPASADQQFRVGDVVEYLRDQDKGRSGGVRGRRWHGPAVITGEASDQLRYCRVDNGGVDLKVHPRDLREAGSAAMDGDPRPAVRQEVVSKVTESQEQRAEQGPVLKRPPGRAPRGKLWDREKGAWTDMEIPIAPPRVQAPEAVVTGAPQVSLSLGLQNPSWVRR